MTRRVQRFSEVPLGFADGYPYLLINEASLHDLRKRCPAGVKLEQFRPNLVVTGTTAWAEDRWATVRIGGILFDAPKPCSRCIFTTVSTERGRRHPTGEPLTTLQKFRTAMDGSDDVDFGINLVARNSGIVRVGDELEVVADKPARLYGAGEVAESLEAVAAAQESVTLSWEGERFSGNNQQVLLEQLEMQGYRIPYSCRAGVCGSCRVRLASGQVRALKKGALREDGTLLSCSCVPDGDLVLLARKTARAKVKICWLMAGSRRSCITLIASPSTIVLPPSCSSGCASRHSAAFSPASTTSSVASSPVSHRRTATSSPSCGVQ